MVFAFFQSLRSRKSDNYRKGNKGKEQRNYTKNKAEKIKSDNFTGSIREKSNFAMAILKKRIIR